MPKSFIKRKSMQLKGRNAAGVRYRTPSNFRIRWFIGKLSSVNVQSKTPKGKINKNGRKKEN